MARPVEICLLSSKFATNYPPASNPELMNKAGRPYACLIIKDMFGYNICIPFRSNIQHRYAYFFRSTERSKKSNSGLDYTKIVIIENDEYIDSSSQVVVDADEYKETILNIDRINREAIAYVDTYVQHIKGTKKIHEKAFDRAYRYSSLTYFQSILLRHDYQADG